MLLLQGVTIGGIPIPSREPLFLATIAVHVAAGVVATVAGAVAMLSHKAAGPHPRSGTVYFWALVVVCTTMGTLAVARWPADNHLAALGILAFTSAFVGRRARRHDWPRWPLLHIAGMGASYVFLLTAFYVDNGPHLPGWRRLPAEVFWFLPAAVGLPSIIHAVRKYRAGGRSPIGSRGDRT
jgi:hypothetical protein